MMNVKSLAAGAVLVSGTMLAGPALAGLSGNVGVVSEYMFRGLAQTGGAAVQGGIDYESDSGLYLGTWVSNIGFAAGTEQDLYVGYATEIGGVGIDVSALYYWYGEEDETGEECSTLEFGLGLSFGPISVGASTGDTEFFLCDGNGESALYLSVGGSFPVSDKLAFDFSLGQYSGDEIERFLGTEDSYIDYMIGLSAELDGGYSATFQYIATDIDDDDPKFVVGLAKSFDL